MTHPSLPHIRLRARSLEPGLQVACSPNVRVIFRTVQFGSTSPAGPPFAEREGYALGILL